jgi:hypothetical protein
MIAGIRLTRGITAAKALLYTTNMAKPAANIATVVIATTVHPKRELGCPCISSLSEATIRMVTKRKGADNPSDDRCPVERLHGVNACEVTTPTPVKSRIRV